MKLVTAEQMRTMEQRAVEAGTPLDELMEAAGLAVAQEAWLALGAVAGRRIAVLVGPGNNGGDGLVAARHLAEWDADVVVYTLAARGDGANLAKVREAGIPLYSATDDAGYTQLDEALELAEFVIDALLGTGRARPIEGALADVLRRLHARLARPQPPRVLAVDVPTGVDADSGRADPLAVRADTTVTLGLAKVGLYALPGADHAGRIEVVDIGLPKGAEAEARVDLLGTPWVRERLPARPKSGNKGTFGRVLVVAGSPRYVGAARLAAEACYRTGTGLVTIACTRAVQPAVAPALPEATYLPLAGDGGVLAPEHAGAIADALGEYDVLLIGPGLGQDDGVREAVVDLLARVPDHLRGCVIDADALNALAKTPGWPQRLRRPAVLTPHPGEMARLRGGSVDDVQDDRLGVAMRAADDWGQTVVLKGAHTVVAAPDGRAGVSPYANPLLASAGTGDVLAGAIAGLLAQGAARFEAACCGVYVHALAAEELREEYGDSGMLAGDLLGALPRAMRTIKQGKPSRGASGAFDLQGALAGLSGAGGMPEM